MARERRHLAAAWTRSQQSFLFAVALIPSLLSTVLVGVADRFSWWALSIVLAAVSIALFANAWYQARREDRGIWSAPTLLGQTDPSAVRHLVCTAYLAPGREEEAVHTWLRRADRLTSVHLILGEDDAATQRTLVTGLEEWQLKNGVDVAVEHPVAVDPFGIDNAALTHVTNYLAPLNRPGTVVDVTGGTKAMSILVHLAASRLGLPVTYVVTRTDARGERHLTGIVNLTEHDLVEATSP